MVIEPSALYAAIGSALTVLVGSIAFWIKTRSTSNAYTAQTQADNSKTQEKTRSDASTTLAEIAKQGIFFQQKMIEVVQENTRVIGEGSAHTQGMLVMMSGFENVLKNAIVGVDDLQGQFPKLHTGITQIMQTQTNLGETINDQFGPVVDALKDVGTQLKGLIKEIQASDNKTNERLTELIVAFQAAETRLLKTLEPVVIAHMGELLSNGAVTLTPSQPTPQEKEPS